MKHIIGRRTAGLIASTIALLGLSAGTSGAAVTSAVTRTFSFIAKPNSPTQTLVNIDSLLINARCSANGSPIVFAFSSASSADIFGRVFDGNGRYQILRNSAFTSKTKGIALSPSSGDFDSTGTVLFETSTGKVVTVSLAFDNSTTLNNQNVCTVYGSFVAT
jgi:hypothetical protein